MNEEPSLIFKPNIYIYIYIYIYFVSFFYLSQINLREKFKTRGKVDPLRP
jgi:hypothetical protein